MNNNNTGWDAMSKEQESNRDALRMTFLEKNRGNGEASITGVQGAFELAKEREIEWMYVQHWERKAESEAQVTCNERENWEGEQENKNQPKSRN